MERFNPFAADLDDPDPFTTSFNRSTPTTTTTTSTNAANEQGDENQMQEPRQGSEQAASRYTTSFPDPIGDIPISETTASRQQAQAAVSSSGGGGSNRSNSVTFAPLSSHSVDDVLSHHRSPGDPSRRRPQTRQTESGGFSSFLSRATSVTSSSVTDRVSGAVGSMRSAVDSLSSQIQQAVPSNINERISSASTLSGGDQQSAASYLASKLSSAGQFVTSSSPSPSAGRESQRVVLLLGDTGEIDWSLQSTNHRRVQAGLTPLSSLASQTSAISSFFSQATAQLSGANLSAEGGDLIEQADFRKVSILANQSTSTATVFVSSSCGQQQDTSSNQIALLQQSSNQPLMRTNSSKLQQQQSASRIVRPDFVVVRQRMRREDGKQVDNERLKAIVNALNYCLVPMFEPVEVWNCFQDRQLLFSKLLRIQRHLGRENFPLIPQVYCQTQQNLLNYANSSASQMPSLIRIGTQGKIRIDNQQMFRDFSTIMATSGLSCTVEPFLDVNYDLVIQKMGTNLKSFKRNVAASKRRKSSSSTLAAAAAEVDDAAGSRGLMSDGSFLGAGEKQSAYRQTSLGTSMLSSLINSTTSASQQVASPTGRRRSSNPANLAYEKVSEVNVRYKTWLEAVQREFDNKIEAFCIKVVVTSDDREYIVGMRDCSMNFLGNLDNQEEDKRSFVELVLNRMNTAPTKHSSVSRAPSSSATTKGQPQETTQTVRRRSSDEKSKQQQQQQSTATAADRKRFVSQSQINGSAGEPQSSRSSGAGLGSRSQSVSVNQSDYQSSVLNNQTKPYLNRRGSEHSDSSLTDSELAPASTNSTSAGSGSLHQRQSSLGQSFFDQTSTAFSSFQKNPMSFFKRFDAPSAGSSNTPPQSAKSDRTFTMSSSAAATATSGSSSPLLRTTAGNGFKSQSMDTPSGYNADKLSRKAIPPAKPPPPAPQALINRQSSLASYSSGSAGRLNHPAPTTPHSTPTQTRQNSAVEPASANRSNRGTVVRQNSALSAFEPFDQELAAAMARETASAAPDARQLVDKPRRPSETATKRSGNFDAASITSGDSNSTAETITGEDTMNNLKKTFASIFGDKECD